ncbi:MAG TPA: hypothetical protein VMZ92_08890 [Planctomycetota bacterium]|nr:hypothetical protein [Planctomycetota bacterium]
MRPRKPPKEGMLATFEGLEAREDGKFTKSMAFALRQAFDSVRDKVNGLLTFGTGAQGSWPGNFDGYVKDFKFPTVADTEVVVMHELGRAPRFLWVALQDRAGSVYVSNYAGWGPQKVYLKASAGDMEVTLVLF